MSPSALGALVVNAPLYPLRLQERLRNYGFGGRWMTEVFQKAGLPDDHALAETWEAVDRPGESNVILNGALAGRTLHEAIAAYGPDLLGADVAARCGERFPLLIKFLDATHPLGEQIHPTDAQAASSPALTARSGGGDTGKTEAWYMLHVRPGATIHVGPRPGLARQELVQALLRKDSRSCMAQVAPQPGEAYLLYAGTMHYSGGGVLFCEIMQNSDITIGLNHYPERGNRPYGATITQPDSPDLVRQRAEELADMIHLEEGFDCRTAQVRLPIASSGALASSGAPGNSRTYIMACRHFAMERLDLSEPYDLPGEGQHFSVVAAIEGAAVVSAAGHAETLRTGQSCLLPAALSGVRLEPQGRAALLVMYYPDLQRDIVAPLRAAGVPDQAILGLGGRTQLNDLRALL